MEKSTNTTQKIIIWLGIFFQWNYQELIKEERRSSFKDFQLGQNQLKNRSLHDANRELKLVVRDINEDWSHLNREQQRLLLNQLELIRDTMKRWKNNVPGKSKEPSLES